MDEGSAAVVETHISVLFFVGDRVLKMRKPVRTPFLDFSTRELRLADCRREVALNRRLAPDVYLGVLDVVDEDGRPVEHLVAMRRLPAARRLSTIAVLPTFDEAHLVAVARQVAAFHARAERSPAIDAAGSVEHLRMLWSTNLAETAAFTGSVLDGSQHAQVARLALDYLDGRHALLARRVVDGRIVDGHGDLLAQDIFCLDDGPRILDCVEFDDRFRWGDVLYDTAFLAMDLEHIGRPDLARRFLATYREFAAESHPASLEHWYIAYRALVRAKIACLRAVAGDPDAPREARTLLTQCDRHLREAELRLVLVGGLPGSGKSTVAEGLADRLGWTVLSSDEVRKDVVGIDRREHAWAEPFEGIYTPAATAAVYEELLHRAGIALDLGESVVLDASWLGPAQRGAALHRAVGSHARLVQLCCTVDLALARERVVARQASGRGLSDATPAVLDALAERGGAPWEGAQAVDTSLSPAESIDRAVSLVMAAGSPDPVVRPAG